MSRPSIRSLPLALALFILGAYLLIRAERKASEDSNTHAWRDTKELPHHSEADSVVTIEKLLEEYEVASQNGDLGQRSSLLYRTLIARAIMEGRRDIKERADVARKNEELQRNRTLHLPTNGAWLSDEKATELLLGMINASSAEEAEVLFGRLEHHRIAGTLASWISNQIAGMVDLSRQLLFLSLLNNIPDPDSAIELNRFVRGDWPKEVRLLAIRLLGRHHERGGLSQGEFVVQFRHESDADIKNGLASLLDLTKPEVQQVLRECVEHPDERLRIRAVGTLDEENAGDRARLLQVLKEDASPLVRQDALHKLAWDRNRCPDAALQALLWAAKNDPDPLTRQKAIRYTERDPSSYSGEQAMLQLLADLAEQDPDEDVRKSAAYALRELEKYK